MKTLDQIIIISEVFLTYTISNQQEKSAYNMLKMNITFKISSNTYLKLRVLKNKFLCQD